jgi:hypothetical protein
MSTPITLPKENSGHTGLSGEVCCNQTFNVESSGIGSGARCFCVKCGAELVIVGNRILGSERYNCR